MRVMRSQDQWRKLIQEQQSSDLPIVDFCQRHQLSTSSFYSVRKKLGLSSGNFVRAKITESIEVIEEQPAVITITVGKANFSLPCTTSATYLSQLLREFAL